MKRWIYWRDSHKYR